MQETLACSPHAHNSMTVRRIMLNVCLALLPCTAWGIYSYGLPALLMLLTTVFAAVATEAFCLKLLKQPLTRLQDSSAVLTGWLLALSLPPWAPWWIAVVGGFFAIAIGKQIYGGIGQNLFNPAMLARVALLISFPLQMTTWPLPTFVSGYSPGIFESFGIIFGNTALPDGVTGPTILGNFNTEASLGTSATDFFASSFSLKDSFFGTTPGSLGETSALLVLLGGIWLIVSRVITWHIPVIMTLSAGVPALLLSLFLPEKFLGFNFHVFSGGLLFGAFFIATDLVTSPASKVGQIIYAFGCGFIDFIIRVWAGFPEGIGFSVLFMNALTPLIDLYCRPKIYGRNLNRQPMKKNLV